ncbi:pilus assembly protein [Helcobacillus massiliensis]|uniref:Pilus assembly protein n=1 Tax=Helcobacillus massiliensis TaxID=521392 RepID=A0A839R0T5_9MICO|nr:pilus assembly protein [Helcobacillus massiliensis]MBB3022006.1 hypothetical protein [Helcobacillus massiliensis]
MPRPLLRPLPRFSARLPSRLREERGSIIAEFPLVMVLVVGLALTLTQLALFVYVRNGLIDAAVQGAHHASLYGNGVEDGTNRTYAIADRRFHSLVDPEVSADRTADGMITVRVRADLPLVGFIGPRGGLVVEGHAVDEDSL